MPASPSPELELRPATLDDVGIVADLEAARDPEDPRDPEMQRFWWTVASTDQVTMRSIAMRDGAAVAYLSAAHERWEVNPQKFGAMRVTLHPSVWSEPRYAELVRTGEDWERSEGTAVVVVHTRETFKHDLDVLFRLGYREVRRQNISELDLVAGRDRLLDAARRERKRLEHDGVRLLTLNEDSDPDRLKKLYEMSMAAEQDIPTTIPMRKHPYDEWHRWWFTNPGIREDRMWIARDADAIVGMSVLEFPPQRGLPWTALTATAREVRGRGIARALKLQSSAQAIELGVQRVRTSNDGANAPILHLNEEMGYRLVLPIVELHKELGP